ncbi:hypothetical protein NUACC26_082990 [Scytonema sp. NUACC26]
MRGLPPVEATAERPRPSCTNGGLEAHTTRDSSRESWILFIWKSLFVQSPIPIAPQQGGDPEFPNPHQLSLLNFGNSTADRDFRPFGGRCG